MDERAGELLKFGIVCDLVTGPTPIVPKLLDLSLSPASSILERGLHSFCSEPLKSVGERIFRKDGKPENEIDLESISVAILSSGSVISQ